MLLPSGTSGQSPSVQFLIKITELHEGVYPSGWEAGTPWRGHTYRQFSIFNQSDVRGFGIWRSWRKPTENMHLHECDGHRSSEIRSYICNVKMLVVKALQCIWMPAYLMHSVDFKEFKQQVAASVLFPTSASGNQSIFYCILTHCWHFFSCMSAHNSANPHNLPNVLKIL